MDLLFFLGRFHVLVLHLPIGIVLLAIVIEFAARVPRWSGIDAAASFLWTLGSVTAVLAVALGLMHAGEGGFDAGDLAAHRLWGVSFAVLTIAVTVLRATAHALYSRIQPIAAVLVLVAMTMTGHYGGNLTHGATFLLEYAPL
ncbi:MAG: hypothetical protein PVF50_03680 [Gammaproteobacteria bacterium]|jgi:uncharacterized membrane protein